MRLGGPIFAKCSTPEQWAAAVVALGYTAAYCPLTPDADDATVRDYARAAERADVVIAEVGAWSNPLDPDAAKAKLAIEKCQLRLDLAERVGARCCVNIAGSRSSEPWDGPHAQNLSDDTFDLIVQTVRQIIDAVKPARTCYALETMPWIFPDSPENYLRLIEAIDRPAFAVHFDPANLINCPSRYFDNAAFMRHCVALLGPRIRSVHVKDVHLSSKMTVHLTECRPGTGELDHAALLRALAPLDADLPIMLEHLADADEYTLAAQHMRQVAATAGINLETEAVQ